MTGTWQPLRGFTVGLTADRKAGELIDAFRRQGAHVLHGPAMRTVPLVDDDGLHAATEALVAAPPDAVVITTGVGFRGWCEAARQWGAEDALLAALGRANVLVRGSKAQGAVRAAGLSEAFAALSETTAELRDHLLWSDVDGMRIAVQQHGQPLRALVTALRDAGAEVTEIAVYRWLPPADPAPLDRLIEAVIAGSVDALAFTSAPAVAGMLERARHTGTRARLEAAMAALLLACVGPVTAAPLIELGMSVAQPERARTGTLVRLVAERLPAASPP